MFVTVYVIDKSLVFKIQFHNYQLFKMYDLSFKSSKLRIFYIVPILTAYNTIYILSLKFAYKFD